MNEQEKQTLRAALRERRERLEAQLPALKDGARPVAPDDALGRLTRMDAIQDQEMTRNALRQAERELAGLERALRQLDDPDFGLCEGCDAPIPMGRLLALPGATHCVNCA